jgi:hypothetical protein
MYAHIKIHTIYDMVANQSKHVLKTRVQIKNKLKVLFFHPLITFLVPHFNFEINLKRNHYN